MIVKDNPNGIPLSGYDAFYQAWDVSANPHQVYSVDAMTWISEWWRANAEAYKSHLEGARDLGNDLGVEDVHHIDGNPHNNDLANLRIVRRSKT